MSGKDKWNQRNYDCITIRFPKGTKQKFRKLFPGVPFNSYVVNLLNSRFTLYEFCKSVEEDKKELL